MRDSHDTTTGASAAFGRMRDAAADLVRRGNRRRVTVRGATGEVWLRLPLTLAALLTLVAAVAWLPLVIVALILLFALRVEVSIDRQVAGPGASGRAA